MGDQMPVSDTAEHVYVCTTPARGRAGLSAPEDAGYVGFLLGLVLWRGREMNGNENVQISVLTGL